MNRNVRTDHLAVLITYDSIFMQELGIVEMEASDMDVCGNPKDSAKVNSRNPFLIGGACV